MGDFLDDCDDNGDLFQKNGLPSWIIHSYSLVCQSIIIRQDVEEPYSEI